MRQLMVVKARTLAWRDVAEPTPSSATDAVVRPFVGARCDGDVMFLRHDFDGILRAGAMMHVVDEAFRGRSTNPFSPAFAYGHECVAEVTACGSDVRRFRVGDRVIVPWSISCGSCAPCAAGLTSKCAPARGDKPLAAFGFARTPGAPVLIVGGSGKSIGLYAAGIARALGSSRVDYLDTSTTRLALAETLGAHAVPLVRSASWYRDGKPLWPEGYPITVDVSGTTAGLRYALGALSPDGTCTAAGFYLRRGTPLPLWQMYMKSVTLRVGVSHPRADLPALLSLIEQKPFDPRARHDAPGRVGRRAARPPGAVDQGGHPPRPAGPRDAATPHTGLPPAAAGAGVNIAVRQASSRGQASRMAHPREHATTPRRCHGPTWSGHGSVASATITVKCAPGRVLITAVSSWRAGEDETSPPQPRCAFSSFTSSGTATKRSATRP
jgi:threonine dehydrogenase-like Zn-dependent dehydrogenase